MAERRFARLAARLALGAALLGTAALAAVGTLHARSLALTELRFDGHRFADEQTLRTLAAVPDSVRLFDVEAALVADRVERAPWVRRARAARRLDGVLAVRVEERVPVALALDGSGAPAYFLDAEGFAMPATPEALAAGFDVPLLTGRVPAYHPTLPVADGPLRRLLAALPDAGPATDALLSGIERRADGQLVLHAGPTPAGRIVPVWVGRDGFGEKLERLHAFWEQAVLSRPDHEFRRVDLRYAAQVVTEEVAPAPVTSNPDRE